MARSMGKRRYIMEIKFYHNPAEKIRLKQSAHDRSLSVIHDDFRDEGNHKTNGEIGRLTFELRADPPEREIKSLDELNLLLFKKEIQYLDLLDLLTIQALSPSRWQRFKDLFS